MWHPFLGVKNDTGTLTYGFPGFHEEAATFLSEERGVYGVGTESASLDHATIRNFPAHINFFKNNVWGLENVREIPDEVPATGAMISVLPLKTKRGSGGPSRVIVTWNTDSGVFKTSVTGWVVPVLIVVSSMLSKQM